MSLIKVENLNKIYGSGETEVKALNNVNLTIEKGEFVAIIGPSGSGKSTLLHMLGGLDIPSSGEVIIGHTKIQSLKDKELSIYRRKHIGFIFQYYNLVSVLNVMDNILLPIKLSKNKYDKKYIDEIIDTLGLKERINFFTNQLSGGQQQRVAIARALANKPYLLLADEPTGNLDTKTSNNVMELLKHFNKKYKQTLVLITHDTRIADMADRKITIEDGQIVNGGVRNEVITSTSN
jgi:putative ABC transport system ATP-binding protein